VYTSSLEVGGSRRTTETAVVLSIWAVVGALVTPVVLRRMVRRQTGSHVEAARDAVSSGCADAGS
jgi:ABC-2 type transport system permease protein